METPTHMATGQVVLLDNGERMYVLGIRFADKYGSLPAITLGSWTSTPSFSMMQPKWYLELNRFDSYIVWLPEYAAWRVTGSWLAPIFNNQALVFASQLEGAVAGR